MSNVLASLTATYTDSEGEEDNENEENTGAVTLNTPNASPDKTNSSKSSPVHSRVTSKVAKLVSYHDDTVVSDEEGDTTEASNTVVILETETAVEEPEPIEEDGIQLPPEPPGHCSMDLQEKIQKLHERMQNEALDMNAVIQQRKDFRNPSIYEKLIQFCGINELGQFLQWYFVLFQLTLFYFQAQTTHHQFMILWSGVKNRITKI